MKIQIEREELLRGLSRVQAIVERRSGLPILSNVLIRAEGERLTLACTDLEVGISSAHPAEVKAPGSITLGAKKLFEIVRELGDSEVALALEKDARVRIECGSARFHLLSISSEEYPTLPSPEGIGFVEVESDLLRTMIDRTLFATSTDESRYYLNGVFIERTEGGRLVFVATDGHRLAKTERAPRAPDGFDFLRKGIIVPRKGIGELRKLCEESDTMVEIGLGENFLLVRRPGLLLSSRLIDAEYPDWRSILPGVHMHRLLIDRELLVRAVRRISLVALERTGGFRLMLGEQSLHLSASNPELGDAREDISIGYEGGPFETSFNARYFLDALGAMTSKEVYLDLTSELEAAVLHPADELDYVAVVMPMRL